MLLILSLSCQPEYDPRKYALIAVADESTRCVQILKYYWWKNDLYVPALEYFCTIGGIYKGCGLRLTRPSSVSYCPGHSGGDLAICDAGARKVYIISHRMIPMRAIDTSFQPDWHIFDDAEVGKSIRPDIYPVSVAFSPDRLLCVAYRDGGLLVYKPYNIARVGKFLDFEVNLDNAHVESSFSLTISLDIIDVVADCCCSCRLIYLSTC